MVTVPDMMKTSVQRAQFADGRRILMISDLHGHAEGLKTLLERVCFSPEDILVIIGDYVEKGPESLNTVRCVMGLCQTHTVYPLMGNVDLWRLQCLLSDDPAIQRGAVQYALNAREWWGSSFLGEMYEECGFSLDAEHDTQVVFPVLREHFAEEIAFLKNLPTILETQRMIFVHGGIPHERLHELEGTESRPLMKRDHFMDEGLSFEKYVVVGHWPAALYSVSRPCCDPLIDRERRILSIDGGCGVRSDGQLNLLSVPDWRSDAFEFLMWNPLPEIIALDVQEASAAFCYIRWGEDHVEVLESKDGMSRIRWQGREVEVPDAFLWESEGQTYCSNYTDYRLQVSPGDRLSLVRTAPCGCYVKKDGYTGWYKGRYQK